MLLDNPVTSSQIFFTSRFYMLRNLKTTHPQRQLELLHLVCPCARGTHSRVASRPPPRLQTITRPFRRQADLTEDNDPSQPPRYLRRKADCSPSPSAASQQHTLPRKQTKHLPSSQIATSSNGEKTGSEIRLLEPHVLSSRLKKLCDAGKIDSAVSMLKNAPLDAQNTPVWNTLIWECMKTKRFKLAYQLFTDVCCHGSNPANRLTDVFR